MNPQTDWPMPPCTDDAQFFAAPKPGPNNSLVVLLPGAYCRPQDFVERGFVAELGERHPHAALLLLPIDPLAVTQGVALSRLADALAPWRDHYERIWLAGISLGALLTLAHLAESAEGVEGALAIAPYLGTRALEQAIRGSGSPATWAATQTPDWDARELEARVWYWLANGGAHQLPVSLGLAHDDRFRSSQNLAGDCWPAEHRFGVPGGHDWSAWRALWTLWLDRVNFSVSETHR
ncbi:hypothetical protein QU481_05695 [Crenobacter sp. SG2303]|uniref:Alpha/beta hydrolase n=1 Tax=Crenobacter oryzisoli TaxID=3056844 RepID=A0ABT7XKQ6_9NEIS|nr:hypothetical protein [Crenobacter sp. SG2303]MDN0074386.1 hypothetical protein [Crenobacter sp. SG2303]